MEKTNGRIIKIIDGSANTPLVDAIESHQALFGSKADVLVTSFSDGETRIEINENMRGCDVFVVQPTSHGANEYLMRLYLILDALKRSNCWQVTAVMPYYGYGRQDKKLKPRVPISARAVADLIQFGGVNRVLAMDLHASQIQGFFNCPVDNLFGSSIFTQHMLANLTPDTIVVSPDEGGIERAIHYSKVLGVGTAMIHKSRLNPNDVDKMILLGIVRDKDVVLIDDMFDTATTICKAAQILKNAGAKSVTSYGTHGIFSGNALEKIEKSSFDTVYITDSIRQPDKLPEKIKILTCADLLAQAILNIHHETSISCLFE